MENQARQGDSLGRGRGWERWLVGRLVPLVTAALTVVTTVPGIVATNQKREIEALDNQLQAELRRSAEVRAERESLERLRLTLYQEVHKVLSSKDISRDSRVVGATATLVRHPSSGDFRDGLLKALEASAQSAEARAVDAGNAAEKAIGTALRDALAKETGRAFALVESSQGTAWYLSAFFCAR